MKTMHRPHLIAMALATMLAGCALPGDTPHAAPQQAASAVNAAKVKVTRVSPAKGIYEVRYSARQNAVFVASAGGDENSTAPSKVLRLDPATLAVQTEIPVDLKAYSLALDDAADRLYAGNTSQGSITVIDTKNNRVVGVMELEAKIRMKDWNGNYVIGHPNAIRELVLDTANNRLYAIGHSEKDSTLFVVNTRTLRVEKAISGFGFSATGVTLDASGSKVYVSNLQGQIYTVDAHTFAVSKAETTAGDQLLNVVYDPGTKHVLATDEGRALLDKFRTDSGLSNYRKRGAGNQVVELDPASGQAVATIPTGATPIALLLDTPHQRLYVTNREGGTVTVYDSRSHALLQTIPLPTHPNSLALDSEHNVLYVTIKNNDKEGKDSNESVARVQF